MWYPDFSMKRNLRTAAEGGSFVTADLEGFKNLKMSITGMNLLNLHYSEMEHSLLQFASTRIPVTTNKMAF